jgi:hypothetical protein
VLSVPAAALINLAAVAKSFTSVQLVPSQLSVTAVGVSDGVTPPPAAIAEVCVPNVPA